MSPETKDREAPTITRLDARSRTVITQLMHGTPIADIAWSTQLSPERVVEHPRSVMIASAPELYEALDDGEGDRIIDYMLKLQSPGQAAGTEQRMRDSEPAQQFASHLRDLMIDCYPDQPPSLPGVDAPARRRHSDPARPRGRGPRARRRQRELEKAEQDAIAVQAMQSAMFRPEAIDHYREGQDRVQIPRFRQGRTMKVLSAVTIVMVLGTLAGMLVKIPSYRQQPALVVSVDGRSQAVAPVTDKEANRLKSGRTLRWQVGGNARAREIKVRSVTREKMSPAVAMRRFNLGVSGKAIIPRPSRLVFLDAKKHPPGTSGSVLIPGEGRRLYDLMKP